MLEGVIKFLKELQTIPNALLLGAGVVVSAFSAWLIQILGYGPWPESVASARISALAIALWIVLGLIAVIVVSLTFGKPVKLSLTGPVVSGEVSFEDEDEEKKDDKKDDEGK